MGRESSNFRELHNLVNAIKEVPTSRLLQGRSSGLLLWIHSCWGIEPILIPMSDAEGWYTTGQGNLLHLWASAPSTADAALEQLGRAKHKRPSVMHVVIVPHLMTATWRKQLRKIVDVLFTVPLSTDAWPSNNHEPLVVAIALPFTLFQSLEITPHKIRGGIGRGFVKSVTNSC
jgi:hypothetical protein